VAHGSVALEAKPLHGSIKFLKMAIKSWP